VSPVFIVRVGQWIQISWCISRLEDADEDEREEAPHSTFVLYSLRTHQVVKMLSMPGLSSSFVPNEYFIAIVRFFYSFHYFTVDRFWLFRRALPPLRPYIFCLRQHLIHCILLMTARSRRIVLLRSTPRRLPNSILVLLRIHLRHYLFQTQYLQQHNLHLATLRLRIKVDF